MPKSVDQNAARARRGLPFGLTGLAGLACAACCAIPLLLAAGILRRRLGRRRRVDARHRDRPRRRSRGRLVVGDAPLPPGRLRGRARLRLLDRVAGMIAGHRQAATVHR